MNIPQGLICANNANLVMIKILLRFLQIKPSITKVLHLNFPFSKVSYKIAEVFFATNDKKKIQS